MIESCTPVAEPDAVAKTPPTRPDAPVAPGPLGLVALAAWCGLLAGSLEALAFAVRKRFFDVNQFLWTTRHYGWLLPVANLVVFLGLGLMLAAAVLLLGGRIRWWAARILGTATLLPAFWAASPRIYGVAGVLLAAGCAARLVPMAERREARFRRVVGMTFPVLILIPVAVGTTIWQRDARGGLQASASPSPPPGTPNVLLIVLDTVAAEHLSVYGYPRRTSPTLEELAARGIRFDRAVATASWTLPSHASLFTGRWPHELSAGWNTPLDGTHPTLAEALGRRGFATAGFVGNRWYCSRDSGLARGFAVYHDDSFPRLTALGRSELVGRPMQGLQAASRLLEDWLGVSALSPAVDALARLLIVNRRQAADIHRELVAWLESRPQPDRPFFAFLNLYDAHYPYEIPEPGIHRFRSRARAERDANLLRDWISLVKRAPTAEQVELGRDFYDDCVADLDERLGRLLDDLARRSVLDRTWLIVTADHGESFGEQPGVFWHGTSLYQAQVHVPLIIVPPGGLSEPLTVPAAVSLRDLPATILDVLGRAPGGDTLPGESLARLWGPEGTRRGDPTPAVSRALSEVVPLDAFGADPSEWVHAPRWPIVGLTEAGWSYIRREKEGTEALHDLAKDPRQRDDLAADPSLRPRLEEMHRDADRLTEGPLSPSRFRP
ncbi:Arylsulfatase [Aquisphaera giovannonii]|uniref:Arylsulfatase n=1 Tax=Aquisphaera giovannonii TaxID=406548 RepID=A0A5B9VYY2_9BACT|nr:sulfatase [Aquisphaera giovannonii]QEH32840.1 Arylsulfatase [Aquisphaera giovannonii]